MTVRLSAPLRVDIGADRPTIDDLVEVLGHADPRVMARLVITTTT